MAVYKNITDEQVAMLCSGYYAGVDEVGRGPLVGDVVLACDGGVVCGCGVLVVMQQKSTVM